VTLDLQPLHVAEKQPITKIRSFIKRRGPARIAAETGISRRALDYIRRGDCKPAPMTRQRIEALMEREREAVAARHDIHITAQTEAQAEGA